MVLGQGLLTKPPRAAFRHQRELKGALQSEALVNANAQDQQVKFEQSLEIVQTLLGASIGCLSFIRGLLPEECFVEKRYGTPFSSAVSYRSFTNDLDESEANIKSGTRIKRLRRGYSGEADKILDWLETGIFDALRRGYLKAVQLAIYVDEKHPDIVIESYTFSFTYRERKDGPSVSLRVTDMHGHGVTTNDANNNLQLMIRRLIVLTQPLDKRWLTIRLHYLDHTPENYDPPDFCRLPVDALALRLCESESKEVGRLDYGQLNTGYHAVSLKLSCLNECDPEERPRRRRTSKFVTTDLDIQPPQLAAEGAGSSGGLDIQVASQINGTGVPKALPKKPGLPVGSEVPPRGEIRKSARIISQSDAAQAPGRETQERLALRSMLIPPQSEIPETQPLEPPLEELGSQSHMLPPGRLQAPSEPRTHQSRALPTASPVNLGPGVPVQQGRLSAARPSGEYPPPGLVPASQVPWRLDAPAGAPIADKTSSPAPINRTAAKLKLSRSKRAELTRGETSLKPKGRATAEASDPRKHTIACECGGKNTSESMICCDNCDNWLHTECYGFTSAKDPRIPDFHVCYSCLLSKNERNILEELRGLALFRKAVRAIWDRNAFPNTNKALAGELECDYPTATQITRRLLDEGFIALIPPNKKGRGQKKAGNAGSLKYKVIKTSEMAGIMEVEYFDPLKKISHHFETLAPPGRPQEPLPKGSHFAIRPSQKTGSIRRDISTDGNQNGRNTAKETSASSIPTEGAIGHAEDADSTADEEDISGPPLKAMNVSQAEPVLDGTINPRLLQVSGSNPQHSKILLEVPSTPEPMELSGGNSQGRGLKRRVEQSAGVVPSHRGANVSTVSSGVYVGCESE